MQVIRTCVNHEKNNARTWFRGRGDTEIVPQYLSENPKYGFTFFIYIYYEIVYKVQQEINKQKKKLNY